MKRIRGFSDVPEKYNCQRRIYDVIDPRDISAPHRGLPNHQTPSRSAQSCIYRNQALRWLIGYTVTGSLPDDLLVLMEIVGLETVLFHSLNLSNPHPTCAINHCRHTR